MGNVVLLPWARMVNGVLMLCECGCGLDAGVYKYTHKAAGQVKGDPRRFLQSHNSLRGTHVKICKRGHPRVEGELKCRVCRAKAVRNWNKNNPEKVKALHLKFKFKIIPEKFAAKLEKQNNACDICHLEFSSENLPCMDHNRKCCSGDRSCGECLRSLLCSRCNAGIGSLLDSTIILESAIQYLKKWEKKTQ
jgi:hypothetical protein